jgi:CheY-like chemotaxis protein
MVNEKITVLIIDDEPDTCIYFSSVLEDHGFNSVIAYDAEEGLTKLKASKPDLITLDIAMPEKSGVKLYREIKLDETWKNIPVIFITGTSDDYRDLVSSGNPVPPPEGYLSKPIDTEEFLALVKTLTTKS